MRMLRAASWRRRSRRRSRSKEDSSKSKSELPGTHRSITPGVGAGFEYTAGGHFNQHRSRAGIPAGAGFHLVAALNEFRHYLRRNAFVKEQVAGAHRMIVKAGDKMARLEARRFNGLFGIHAEQHRRQHHLDE